MPNVKFDYNKVEYAIQSISQYIDKKTDDNNLVLLKHSSDKYCQSNAISLKILIDRGFKGIFISFQRPAKNLNQWLEKNNIDKNKFLILDYSNPNKRDFNKLYEDIFKSIKKISGNKKFVFIDSLNTMALCDTDMCVDDFTDRLLDNFERNSFDNTIFIVNSARELSRKDIVKNFCAYADEIIDISIPKEKYSNDLTKDCVFT